MGQVATTAAVYMLSKLRMHQVAEIKPRGLFELESVDVSAGLLRPARLPRSRFYLWRNPHGGRDVVVFLGEAQPPMGKVSLCERLLAEGRALGVSRVFTFSAMATEMHPGRKSRTFGVASDPRGLEDLKRHDVEILPEGRIEGLNGVVLAAAAEAGLPAVGLLGEIPALTPQLPCPNASAAVLRAFAELAGISLDLTELENYGRALQEQMSELYGQLREALEEAEGHSVPDAAEAEPERPAPEPEQKPVGNEDAERVERLFMAAGGDRAVAFELKKELDRLGVFSRYEDRFLDLFEPHP